MTSPGYKKGLLGGLKGSEYQVHVLMWLYGRAANNNYADFRLASEMDSAGKYDDAVLSWRSDDGEPQPNWLLVQVKHKQREKLSQSSLLPTAEEEKRNGDFSLYKYLLSFWNVERNVTFSGRRQYVIFTNSVVGDQVQDWFEDAEKDAQEILKIAGSGSRLLRMKFNDQLCKQLIEYVNRDFNELVTALTAVVIDGNSELSTDIFCKYRAAIACKILVVDKNLVRFAPRFIKKRQLDPLEQKLRENLFKNHTTLDELTSLSTTNEKISKDLTSKGNSSSVLPPAVDQEDVKNFWNQLVFAVNQPGDAELEKIICDDLAPWYDSPIQDPESQKCCITLWFTKLEKMIKSWLDAKEGTFLGRNELEVELRAAQRAFTNSKLDVRTEIFQGKMQNLYIEFSETDLPLSQTPLAIISSTEDGLVTSIKVYQEFKNTHLRYFTFEDLQVPAVLEILHDILRDPIADFYLIIKDNCQNFNFHTELLRTILSSNFKKIVLLTHSQERANSFFDGIDFTQVIDADVNVTHLSHSSRRMLEQRTVIFQGNELTLTDLPGYLSNKSLFKSYELEKLIRAEPLLFGPDLPTLETKQYIPRIISSANPDELRVDSIAAESTKSGLHVNYSEEQFLEDLPAVFEKNKIVVLSSTTGMGKSTLWTHLALLANRLDRRRWVVIVKLQDWVDQLAAKSSVTTLKGCIGLLGQMIPFKSTLDRELFGSCLQESPDGVYLFFDGFDELSHEVANRALGMFQTLRDSARLFINTRVHRQEELEKALGVKAYYLNPMSQSNQKDLFLSQVGINRSSGPLDNFMNSLSTKIQSKSLDLASKFFGVPLIINMLAEIYKPHVKRYKRSKKSKFLTSIDLDTLNILQLFEKFVYGSFCRRNLEKLKLDEDNQYVQQILAPEGYFFKGFENLHCFLGMLSLVKSDRTQQIFGDLDQLSELQQQAEVLESPIVSKYVEHQPSFIHASIGELFAAKCLIGNLLKMTLEQITEKFVNNRPSRDVPNKRGAQDLWDLYYQVLRDYPSVRKFFLLFVQQRPSCLEKVEQLFWCMRPYPLLWACEENILTIAEKLIEEDPSIVTEAMKQKKSPLHYAALQDAHQICTLLLDHGADLNATNLYKQSALHVACINGSYNVAKLLITHGATVDCPDQNLYTPLHFASQAGQTKIVQLLIDHHCNVNLQTKKKWNALHIAAFNNHVDTASLLSSQNIQLKVGSAKSWLTFLGHLVAQGFNEVATVLIEHEVRSCKDFNKTLTWAVRNDHVAIIRALHQSGVNVHAKGDHYRLALRQHKHKAALELLRLRSPTDTLDHPLHAAAEAGSAECLNFLLSDVSAEVNAVNQSKVTALDLALKFCHPEAIQVLLDHHASLKNNSLHTVTKSVDCLKVLLRHGAHVDTPNDTNNTALHVATLQKNIPAVWFLLQNGASLQAKGNDGRTVLHVAAAQGLSDLVPALLAHPRLLEQEGTAIEEYVNAQDRKGQTAMHLVCAKGFIEIAEHLRAAGAKLDILNNRKQAPIHLAAMEGCWDSFNWLMDHKVDIQAVDGQGMAHLELAAAGGHADYIRKCLKLLPSITEKFNVANAIELAKENGHLLLVGELVAYSQ